VKVLAAGSTRAAHLGAAAALFMLIMMAAAVTLIQQVRHHCAQHAAGHRTNYSALSAGGLITHHGTGSSTDHRAHYFIGEGASACQGQRQGQGREDFHSHDSHR
jgi:hypothetical protein